MSNHVDKGKQPMDPYQWMLHWSALQEHIRLSTLLGDHGKDHGTNQWHLQQGKEITSNISRPVEQRKKIIAIDFGILKSDQPKRSRNRRKDRLKSSASSIGNLSQESQHIPNVENIPLLLSLALPGTESSYMDYHIQRTSVSQCPRELVKSQNILDLSLGFSAPFPEDFNATASGVSPQIIDLGEGRCESVRISTAPSFLCRVEEKENHVRSILSLKRKLSDTNIMKVMEHEKCIDGSGVLSDNLSMRQNHPPAFHEEQYKKMNDLTNTNLFSTSAHEANAMRVYTSAEDLSGLTPSCQVNQTYPVMEATDTNLRKEDKNLRDSGVRTRVQETVPIKCCSLTQLTGKQEVPIHVLSSDSEGEDDVQNVKATEVVLKNTISAETHAMDMNMIKEKHVSGVESSSSKKNVNANTDLPHIDLATGTPGEKVQPHRNSIPAIPDMNIQLQAEPGEESLVDNAEPSTRTQSLDMDYVPDSNTRCLKRLKISDPCHHSVGTKSLDEATTNNKVVQFVSKGKGGESSNSESVPVSTGKELMIVNQKTTPPEAAVSSSKDKEDESEEKKRLHSWIQRWQKSPAATPKDRSEPVVTCDPQCLKESLEELEKKPLPNIAAMALLGKGWKGLKCQYRNEGSFIVWES